MIAPIALTFGSIQYPCIKVIIIITLHKSTPVGQYLPNGGVKPPDLSVGSVNHLLPLFFHILSHDEIYWKNL